MKYFKDDKDGTYALNDDCLPDESWVEIKFEEWQELNPAPNVVEKTNNQLLAETDVWMSRISEDTVVALINKGVAQKSDYAPIVIERINYRRSLRNQPPI